MYLEQYDYPSPSCLSFENLIVYIFMSLSALEFPTIHAKNVDFLNPLLLDLHRIDFTGT